MFTTIIITIFHFWAVITRLLVSVGLPLEVSPQGGGMGNRIRKVAGEG